MRRQLQKIEEIRDTFTGTFERKGIKNGYHQLEETVLLTHICNTAGETVTDHLWFNYTKGFQKVEPLQTGDQIQFDARCKGYMKGYKGRREDVYKPCEWDYKLAYPTRIKKIIN